MQIEVNDISKQIGNQTVLDHISLHLESGYIYGLKGRNGSGKTMLMRALCGLIKCTSGEVIIDGQVLRRDISFPKSVGVLIEGPGFISNYSGYENLKTIASIKGIAEEKQIRIRMSELGLDPDEKKAYRKYSLGMKQKLGIVAAVMEEPELIILDEPTNALDEKTREQLRKILLEMRAKGKLIVISCHDTEDLEELSDEIIEIKEGKVVSQWSVNADEEK